jgi:CBS domain containing-hemolysin-like protein
MSIEIGLLVAILLLLGNAFFVAAEFSMVSVRRSAIEPEAAKGSKRALLTLRALENVSFLMAGAQLGITLCSLGLGAVAEPTIAHALEKPFHWLDISEALIHPLSFTIALIITVFLHVVIGEMVPKNIALAKPERSALILTPMLVFVVRILNPLVHSLNLIANLTLRLFNVSAQPEVSSTYTRDEMADLVKESRKEGYLSEDNEQLLSGALSFDVQSVKHIARPVSDLKTVDRSITYAEVEALATETGFSRFPVTRNNGDMIGYVHIKDIIKAEDDTRHEKLKPKAIRDLAQVSANQSIRMTLKIMQRSGAHISLVLEGKTIVGVVTLEDVLEELVGEMSQQKATA